MGWQLVSDVVSGRSESTLKARLGYLERYFAWCSDHRLPWVPLTVSATWKWMQALKDASPSAPTSGYQSLRWFAHMFRCCRLLLQPTFEGRRRRRTENANADTEQDQPRFGRQGKETGLVKKTKHGKAEIARARVQVGSGIHLCRKNWH